MSSSSDKDIIRYIKDPEQCEKGFNMLVKEYHQQIYWHIRKIVYNHEDANDITQNVFIKIWKNIHSFRKDSKLYTWIYRISTNEALTFLKSSKKRQTLSIHDHEEVLSGSSNDNYFSGDEIQKKLQVAVQKLPYKQRLVFLMKYYQDMPYKEISDILKTSIGSLKANYHHAVKKIEKSLEDD
jgi:RNA polymerase sigma-70 factor (ECF subfamily)